MELGNHDCPSVQPIWYHIYLLHCHYYYQHCHCWCLRYLLLPIWNFRLLHVVRSLVGVLHAFDRAVRVLRMGWGPQQHRRYVLPLGLARWIFGQLGCRFHLVGSQNWWSWISTLGFLEHLLDPSLPNQPNWLDFGWNRILLVLHPARQVREWTGGLRNWATPLSSSLKHIEV